MDVLLILVHIIGKLLLKGRDYICNNNNNNNNNCDVTSSGRHSLSVLFQLFDNDIIYNVIVIIEPVLSRWSRSSQTLQFIKSRKSKRQERISINYQLNKTTDETTNQTINQENK